MTHRLMYVKAPGEGSCYWQLFCACLNEGQPGRAQDPIFATGWIGGIYAHEAGVACPSGAGVNGRPQHDSQMWTVRRIDATHVEFSPSINAEAGGHFHTSAPTGPVEVRA